MQFWQPRTDNRELLTLFKSPTRLDPSDLFSSDRLGDTVRDVTTLRRQSIEICGGQPATYVEARGSNSRGESERVDLVMTDAGGSSYVAMYVRPATRQPNPMALAALREVCPKP